METLKQTNVNPKNIQMWIPKTYKCESQKTYKYESQKQTNVNPKKIQMWIPKTYKYESQKQTNMNLKNK